MADAVSGKQAGSWPPAMPADSSPHQLRLKAHPLSWSPEEELEEVAITIEQPAVTHTVDVEPPAATCPSPKRRSLLPPMPPPLQHLLHGMDLLRFVSAAIVTVKDLHSHAISPVSVMTTAAGHIFCNLCF